MLSDSMEMDADQFNRDAFCLSTGVRPYKEIHPHKLEAHHTHVHLRDFSDFHVYRRGRHGGEVIEPALISLDSQKYETRDHVGTYCILELSRFVPSFEILQGFLERDGFVPATFNELLAYMYLWKDKRRDPSGGQLKDISAFVIGSNHEGRYPYFRWYMDHIHLELHEYGLEAHKHSRIFETMLVKVKSSS
tara:strand:+ start:12991 stop:13563 length:573 start_codon:yes stop_codon:yes gene_type:complete